MVINMHGLYFLAEQQMAADGYAENDIMGRFLGKGLQTALLGLVTVFVVLSLLWGCLEIFRYVFYTLPERKKNASQGSASAVQVTESVPAPTAEPTVCETDDGELVAAIMAAVSAYRAEEGAPAVGFRVVSFRKKSRK